MVTNDLKRGERLIRESTDIVIKESIFTLFLTDRRLICEHDDRKYNFDIDMNVLSDIEFYETEHGEPLFVISIRDKKKKGIDEIKRLIVVFSQQFGQGRNDEAEMLFSHIHAFIRKHQKAEIVDAGIHKTGEGSGLDKSVCRKCGRDYREGAKYCTFCGSKIIPPVKKDQKQFVLFSFKKPKTVKEDKMTLSGFEIPPEEPSSELMSCRVCGDNIPVNSLFCKYCGAMQLKQKQNDWKFFMAFRRFFDWSGKKPVK